MQHRWGRWSYWHWLCCREEVFPGKSHCSGVSVVQTRNQSWVYPHLSAKRRLACMRERATVHGQATHLAMGMAAIHFPLPPGNHQFIVYLSLEFCTLLMQFWLALVGKRKTWQYTGLKQSFFCNRTKVSIIIMSHDPVKIQSLPLSSATCAIKLKYLYINSYQK